MLNRIHLGRGLRLFLSIIFIGILPNDASAFGGRSQVIKQKQTVKTTVAGNNTGKSICREYPAGAINSPVPYHWSFCMTLNFRGLLKKIQNNSADLFYFWDGAGGSEYFYQVEAINIRKEWKRQWRKQRIKPPIEISITVKDDAFVLPLSPVAEMESPGGIMGILMNPKLMDVLMKVIFSPRLTQNTYVLAHKNPKGTKSGLADDVLERIMPFIESQPEIRFDSSRGKRSIMGVSLGGFNAMQLVLSAPEKFENAVFSGSTFFERYAFSNEYFDYINFIRNYKLPNGGSVTNDLAEMNTSEQRRLMANIFGPYVSGLDKKIDEMSEREIAEINDDFSEYLHPFERLKKIENMNNFPNLYFTMGDEEWNVGTCALMDEFKRRFESSGIGGRAESSPGRKIHFSIAKGAHAMNLMSDSNNSGQIGKFILGQLKNQIGYDFDATTCRYR